MKRKFHILAVALQSAVLLGWQIERAAAQVTGTYLFRDSFAPIEGTGAVLVPVSNGAGTIVTSGPDFLNGVFVTETISASACPSTPTVRAWSFPVTAGLRHDNAVPTVVTGSYSISMLMRYNPMDGSYARLIDFSNSTLDTGIYKLTDGVSFFPVGTYAAGSFVTNQDVFVTITRDAGTKLVSLYINGLAAGTYTDTGDLYAPSATLLYFLMDNTTGSAAVLETDPGVIAYLQVRDTPMTAVEVTASLSAICDVVACGDGVVGGSETCDDGNSPPGDGCSAICTVEAAACANAPAAATYDSVICRIDALLTRVQAETHLGAFQAPSAKNLQQAKDRTEAATAQSPKKAGKGLQQAAKALTQFAHRLASLTARKKLDTTLRTDLKSAGEKIARDVRTLRSQL